MLDNGTRTSHKERRGERRNRYRRLGSLCAVPGFRLHPRLPSPVASHASYWRRHGSGSSSHIVVLRIIGLRTHVPHNASPPWWQPIAFKNGPCVPRGLRQPAEPPRSEDRRSSISAPRPARRISRSLRYELHQRTGTDSFGNTGARPFMNSPHCPTRQLEWHKTRDVTRAEVEAVTSAPQQVVRGHAGVLVAQSRLRGGLLRVPFVEVEGCRKIVTLYWTSQVARYWED